MSNDMSLVLAANNMLSLSSTSLAENIFLAIDMNSSMVNSDSEDMP